MLVGSTISESVAVNDAIMNTPVEFAIYDIPPAPVQYSNKHMDITLTPSPDMCYVRCTGTLKTNLAAELVAANPVDFLTSYTGSFQPFPNSVIAFENTPNRKQITTALPFDVVFGYPNAYYAEQAWVRVPPSVFAQIGHELVRYELPDPYPLKSQTYRDTLETRGRSGPEFYARREAMGVHGQETLLRNFENAKKRLRTA